ncbi:MAG: DUF1080 domain-containing protein, partial [Planctomycetes bacterium]|nr:DUF1080 domain-containing protein [Planctomycetota bacterium]
RTYRLRLRVTAAKIEAWMDEEQVIDLPRVGRTLGPGMWSEYTGDFGIVNQGSKSAIHAIKLRRVEGLLDQPTKEPKGGEWQSLFDGKTLEGWRVLRTGSYAGGGEVAVRDGAVQLGGGVPRTGICAAQQLPRLDYEFALEAMRVEGNEGFASVVFPIGNAQCLLIVGAEDGKLVCLDSVRRQTGGRIETKRRLDFVNRQWYEVRLRVTAGRLEAWIGKERMVDLATPECTFELPSRVAEGVQPFTVCASKGTVAALCNIRLRRIEPGAAEGPKAGEWPFNAAEARRRQAEAAKALGVEAETDIALGGGAKMTLVLIPAGEFLMGSAAATSPEQLQKAFGGNAGEFQPEFPQRRVKISRPFWLGKTEVTQAQWQAVMGENPSHFKGKPQNPVDNVSWDDCQGFLQKLSAKFKRPFRLPTEAEWEYACRAGTATEFYFGDAPAALPQHAWFEANSGGSPQAVGKTRPNAWGLCDMAGNLREWCEDWFGPYDNAPQTDPQGPATGTNRVLRSGYWNGRPGQCRSAFRHMTTQTDRGALRDLGFRVCVAARGAATAAQDARPGEWQSLFDGKTLKGWRGVERFEVPARDGTGMGGKARVEEEKLVVEAGQPLSGIAYTGDVPKQDYEVSLEAMKVSGGDTFCVIQFPVGGT